MVGAGACSHSPMVVRRRGRGFGGGRGRFVGYWESVAARISSVWIYQDIIIATRDVDSVSGGACLGGWFGGCLLGDGGRFFSFFSNRGPVDGFCGTCGHYDGDEIKRGERSDEGLCKIRVFGGVSFRPLPGKGSLAEQWSNESVGLRARTSPTVPVITH